MMRKWKPMIRAVLVAVTIVLASAAVADVKEKTESFDKDPQWEGVNNHAARKRELATIKQDFGWSKTNKAGGDTGEIGGYISPAGEVAYYGTAIQQSTLDDKFTASGTMWVGPGGTHLLLGFFNPKTAKEWRTNNTISMRINPRDDKQFFAYADYCTALWGAGGQLFTTDPNPTSSRAVQTVFKIGAVYPWSLTYDPSGNNGGGTVTATLGDQTSVSKLEPHHKKAGATLTHFGIMNIAKSADKGSEFFVDNLIVNGRRETFDNDPKWEAKKNRETYKSKIIRPLFDFGFSPTQFAGGKSKGEMGGLIFRGDCRYPERMACYGDKIGPLTLDRPIKASGKIVLTRGVTDTTALFGFYNAAASMRRNDSQQHGVPESVLGVHIEGPSSEGFLFYPVCRPKTDDARVPAPDEMRKYPPIYPDGKSHDWTLEYDPAGAGGKGQITIVFDGVKKSMDLQEGDKSAGAEFDRFGIVTSWIDGNSVDVYWDDITYTVAQ